MSQSRDKLMLERSMRIVLPPPPAEIGDMGREKIVFQEGKDIEIVFPDAEKQSYLAQRHGSIEDFIVFDLINRQVEDYEDKLSRHNKLAESFMTNMGREIRAFDHYLIPMMRDPHKVAADSASLKKGLIVEGNRVVIPADLITTALLPIVRRALDGSVRPFSVRFIAPISKPESEVTDREVSKVVGDTVGETKSASHLDTYKWWYIGGGTALAVGITAAVVMRNRK